MNAEHVRAAVTFLQSQKLSSLPLKDKLKFLKEKGLNELEIDEALNMALHRQNKQSNSWNFLIFAGICFGGYKLYNAYLEKQKQKDPTLDEILKTITELKRLIESQKGDIQSLKTLMLSHDKFAAPPVIPEWQLKDD